MCEHLFYGHITIPNLWCWIPEQITNYIMTPSPIVIGDGGERVKFVRYLPQTHLQAEALLRSTAEIPGGASATKKKQGRWGSASGERPFGTLQEDQRPHQLEALLREVCRTLRRQIQTFRVQGHRRQRSPRGDVGGAAQSSEEGQKEKFASQFANRYQNDKTLCRLGENVDAERTSSDAPPATCQQ